MKCETKIKLAMKKLKCITTKQLLSRLLESSIPDRVMPEGHTPRSKNNLSNQQYFLCSKEKIFEPVEFYKSQQEIVLFKQNHHVTLAFCFKGKVTLVIQRQHGPHHHTLKAIITSIINLFTHTCKQEYAPHSMNCSVNDWVL